MINIKGEKKKICSKSATGSGRDIGGSGGVVDYSGTGGSGGKDSVASWCGQRERVGKQKEKVVDRYPGMELFKKGRYMWQLGLNHFIPMFQH